MLNTILLAMAIHASFWHQWNYSRLYNNEVLTWLLTVSLERSSRVDSWTTWALRPCSVSSSFSLRHSSWDRRSRDVLATTSHLLTRIWFCVCSESICCCSEHLSTSQLCDLHCHSCDTVTINQHNCHSPMTTRTNNWIRQLLSNTDHSHHLCLESQEEL